LAGSLSERRGRRKEKKGTQCPWANIKKGQGGGGKKFLVSVNYREQVAAVGGIRSEMIEKKGVKVSEKNHSIGRKKGEDQGKKTAQDQGEKRRRIR